MPSHATTLIFLRQCVVVLRTVLTLLETVHYLRGGGRPVGLGVGQSFKNSFKGWVNGIINKERGGPS